MKMHIRFTNKKLHIRYFYAGIIAGALCISPLSANVQSQPPASDMELSSQQQLRSFQSNAFLHNTLIPHDHPLVEKFRKQYMCTDGYNYLSSIMKRSAPYRDFIIELLAAENMPAELLFLPVIESGFFEVATSKSGAVGIWQFMRNSVGGFNIHIDDWVDEKNSNGTTANLMTGRLRSQPITAGLVLYGQQSKKPARRITGTLRSTGI